MAKGFTIRNFDGNKGTIEVEWNEQAFVEFLTGGETEAELSQRAGDVAATARGMAPVDTGKYRQSIHTEIEHGTRRSRVRIVADVPYAMKIERRYGTLGKAMRAHAVGE